MNLKKSGLIDHEVASLWISGSGGKLTLGGSATESVSGDWYSHKLIYNYDSCCSNPFWMIKLNNLLIGGERILVGDSPDDKHHSEFAILESTSPFIFLKQKYFETYLDKLK